MPEHSCDIAIAGGGPVGMSLAIELGQRGIRTAVIERHPAPRRVPKGQNLTQRTMEHMAAWGVEDAVRAARTVPAHFGIGGLTAYGTLLSGWHYDWLVRSVVRPYYFTDNERLPQYATEEVLRARAAELDTVELLYGWSTEHVAETAGGVRAEIREHRGEARDTVSAHYLVGCDGSRSGVREAAGIAQTRTDHDKLMALIVFRSPEFLKMVRRFPDKQFFNVLHPDLDGYWMFFGMVDGDGAFFFHAPVPRDTTRDGFDFAAYLQRAVGAEFPLTIDYAGFWDLRIAIADTYRAGRVFIAGDAAHSHPPYGAYGINTGFEDARNLGWKLAAVLAGWGRAGLLDSYDAERRPVFASTARDFIEHMIETDRHFVRTHDPERDRADFETAWAARSEGGVAAGVAAYEPHYDASPIVAGSAGGTTSAVGEHRFAARPGHHLAPQPLSDGRSVAAALGAGFTLLAFDAAEAEVERLVAAAAARGMPLAIVVDSRAGGREAYGATLILVRPDHFVAWAGETCPDPEAVLSRAIGA